MVTLCTNIIDTEGYIEQVLIPKYGLRTLYENVSKADSCNCPIF